MNIFSRFYTCMNLPPLPMSSITYTTKAFSKVLHFHLTLHFIGHIKLFYNWYSAYFTSLSFSLFPQVLVWDTVTPTFYLKRNSNTGIYVVTLLIITVSFISSAAELFFDYQSYSSEQHFRPTLDARIWLTSTTFYIKPATNKLIEKKASCLGTQHTGSV